MPIYEAAVVKPSVRRMWGRSLRTSPVGVGVAPATPAILDQFLHHADVLSTTGNSYRLRHKSRQSHADRAKSAKPEA